MVPSNVDTVFTSPSQAPVTSLMVISIRRGAVISTRRAARHQTSPMRVLHQINHLLTHLVLQFRHKDNYV